METIFERIIRESGTSRTGEASYQIDKQADLLITYQRPSKKWFVQVWKEKDLVTGEYINIEIPQRQARSILSNLDRHETAHRRQAKIRKAQLFLET